MGNADTGKALGCAGIAEVKQAALEFDLSGLLPQHLPDGCCFLLALPESSQGTDMKFIPVPAAENHTINSLTVSQHEGAGRAQSTLQTSTASIFRAPGPAQRAAQQETFTLLRLKSSASQQDFNVEHDGCSPAGLAHSSTSPVLCLPLSSCLPLLKKPAGSGEAAFELFPISSLPTAAEQCG